MQSVYESVARLMEPIDHIAALLAPDVDKSSETVEWEMTELLAWVKQTYTEENDELMVDNLFRYSKGFWKGLFTCYDHYYIPRTNNDLEQFSGRQKLVIVGLRAYATGTPISSAMER